MTQNCSLISGLLLAVVFTAGTFCVRYQDCYSLKLHGKNLSKVGSKLLSYRTNLRSGGERLINAVAVEKKLTALKYNETFAYGCLKGIPIPNVTLDETFTPQQERNVLMEIFNQTAGHNWDNNTHWGNDSVSHCFWYGITCDHTNRYIISIVLRMNNLVGTLPRTLWKLRNLQCLWGGNNKGLSGDVNEILSPNMTSILRVDLAFNKLSGKIPGEILVNMESLVVIQLCCQMGEGLTGEIPKDIGNLTELRILSFGENKLYGSIPKSIAKLKKLWFLDLKTATYLNSGFENLFNLSSLRYMHLSLAGLNGTLPDEFGLYFPEMRECRLPGNHFTGNIPSTMGNMTNLRTLNLARNHLSGQIPKSIGLIPMLQFGDFSGNQLSSLEEGIKFKSQSLEVLLLASNKQLTMTFHSLLEAMESMNESLRILNVSDCNFLGTIPAKLWDFKNLISVDLKNNSLIGKFPWTYNNMLFLHDIDVSANNLTGQIPNKFAELSSLEFLDISKNPYMHETDEQGGTLPNFMKVVFTT
ncbi:hypothetical protein OS493_037733 [Desmophyllum pertusum]|uniref:Leucine-rich repeat-containing N-terminal plant-type domain-containing protein n=1 Tax=Desmophyllum pertusum TaxID=174260 RepID=A0A9X0CHM9_9CNID|nr:hypothetical protein OS493_037733 [Desmophyllum pertusum]